MEIVSGLCALLLFLTVAFSLFYLAFPHRIPGNRKKPISRIYILLCSIAAGLLFVYVGLMTDTANTTKTSQMIAQAARQSNDLDAPSTSVNITPLSANEEQRLVASFNAFKAKDGSSIAEVLSYAEKERSHIFKIESIGSSYDHNSNLTGVGLCFWVGVERSEETKVCSIEFSADRASLKIIGPDGSDESSRLASGKKSFVAWIDDSQSQDCNNDPDRMGCDGYRRVLSKNQVEINGEYGCDSTRSVHEKISLFATSFKAIGLKAAGASTEETDEIGKIAQQKMVQLYREHCTQLYGVFKKIKTIQDGSIYITLIKGKDGKQYWWPED